MCTFLLILQSMVCSPLLVRYHVTEMTAIYYYNISQNTSVGNLGQFH